MFNRIGRNLPPDSRFNVTQDSDWTGFPQTSNMILCIYNKIFQHLSHYLQVENPSSTALFFTIILSSVYTLFNLSVVKYTNLTTTYCPSTPELRLNYSTFLLLFFVKHVSMENTLTLCLRYENTLWHPGRQVFNESLVWASLLKWSKMCKYHPFYWLKKKSC